MNWIPMFHAVHVLAAGLWVGGLFFTASVVSPAFKRMEWTPVERVAVRSEVGRQYSRVARANLAVLVAAAVADWMGAGWGAMAVAELALIGAVVLLSELHARFYAPRLAVAARERKMEERARLLRVSLGVSMVNLLASVGIVVLSSLARG